MAEQPNLANIGGALGNIGGGIAIIHHEVDLLPNHPMMNQPQQVLQDIQRLHGRVQELQEQLDQINDRLQNAEDLLPMRLYNACVYLSHPIRYPVGIIVEPPMPSTKAMLRDMTVAQCILVAGALGLPPLEGAPLVSDRRSQISEYLGCAMDFQ